jgi:UDP-N-acetylmuramoylalanine--D-glutamate ligase
MNYYDGDMDRYFHDKTAIFRHQKPGDVLITTVEIADIAKREHDKGDLKSDWIIAQTLPPSIKMKIPGAHNLVNAALAKAAAQRCEIDDETIATALQDFEGVEGRLKFVGEWEDRSFYNDSNATTQEATLAALASFPAYRIVLIFGGSDKGLPVDRMLDTIAEHNIRCILLKGTGSDRVLQKLPDIEVASSMAAAVKRAVELSEPEDNIILSPAFASFGLFKNEYDRSDQFMVEVEKIIAGAKGAAWPR